MHMDAAHLQNNDYYNRSNKSCNVQFKSIEKFIQGIRKSHLNFASEGKGSLKDTGSLLTFLPAKGGGAY